MRTFLRRDVPSLQPAVPVARLERFWCMLAHRHGQLWSAAELWRHLRHGYSADAWKRWLSWAMGSRLEPIKKVARMVREHLWGILNAATNASSESVNARIQRVKRMACGFRNKLRFRAAILFHLGTSTSTQRRYSLPTQEPEAPCG